ERGGRAEGRGSRVRARGRPRRAGRRALGPAGARLDPALVPGVLMAQFWQQVVSGLATGGIYASLALALVLIYSSTRVINFAQGELATLATYVAWTLIDHGIGFWGAFFLTLAIAFAGGVALERIVIRPVERAPVLTIVMVTLGLLIGLNGLVTWLWGGETKTFPSAFSTRTFGWVLDVLGVAIPI